jgi:lysylphosphatidylglycerol synthetase-like protein (DUF2156 family)
VPDRADVPLSPAPSPAPPPPRAFTQGVGTVFQFVGVTLFLLMMTICCGSGLLSHEWASKEDRTRIGWRVPGAPPGQPFYSYQQATTLSVTLGVFLGLALAGLGLGLQAQRRLAPWGALVVALLGTLFWLAQTAFAVWPLGSVGLTLAAAALTLLFAALLALSIGAAREMWANPPPRGHELLPADYKVPYSHLHEDPPEVRIARELDQRRERLAVQQKELELLEQKLQRKMQQPDE